jgi:hypothetical protein
MVFKKINKYRQPEMENSSSSPLPAFLKKRQFIHDFFLNLIFFYDCNFLIDLHVDLCLFCLA